MCRAYYCAPLKLTINITPVAINMSTSGVKWVPVVCVPERYIVAVTANIQPASNVSAGKITFKLEFAFSEFPFVNHHLDKSLGDVPLQL